MEATEFRDRIPQFEQAGVQIYGLSPDDLESHGKFAEKHKLNFPLLSDPGHRMIEQWGLWVEKEWEGKKFMGVSRTTLLVGPDSRLEQLWEKVKFLNHAEEVLNTVQGTE